MHNKVSVSGASLSKPHTGMLAVNFSFWLITKLEQYDNGCHTVRSVHGSNLVINEILIHVYV